MEANGVVKQGRKLVAVGRSGSNECRGRSVAGCVAEGW